MRTKKAFFNMISYLTLQVLVILSGFLTKNLFIAYYGSTVNGMIGSVDQIISALAILEAGVGSAAILSLYKPLREKNTDQIGKILGATKNFYYKSGIIYVLIIAMLVIFYPMLIENQVASYDIRLMIIILSAGNVIDYFLFGKYRVLLTADQKLYVINVYQGISTILSTIVIVLLIQNGFSYLIVKAVGAVILMLRFFVVQWYFRKNYKGIKIDSNISGVELPQRWSAFVHMVASVVVFNTDLLILTIFLGENSLIAVSIYGVYNLIITSLSNIVSSLSTAFMPGFGDLLLEKDKEKIRRVFQNFEFISFFIIFVVYSCLLVLLRPFISVYTQNIHDANYVDTYLVLLFTTIAILQSIRIPGNTMISAIGHFKETQWRAILEATLNLVLSILFVNIYGIYGVLLGTVCSFLYRSFDMIIYNARHIVENTLAVSFKRLIGNTVMMIGLYLLFTRIPFTVESYFDWLVYAILVGSVTVLAYIIYNFIFERKEMLIFYRRVVSLMRAR